MADSLCENRQFDGRGRVVGGCALRRHYAGVIPFAINLISYATEPSFILTLGKGVMALPDEIPAVNFADDAQIEPDEYVTSTRRKITFYDQRDYLQPQ